MLNTNNGSVPQTNTKEKVAKFPTKQKATTDRFVFLELLGLTELKLARRFMKLEENENSWVFNMTRNKWLFWNKAENIWVEDNLKHLYQKISEFVENLSMELTHLTFDDKEWSKIEKFIERTQSAQGLRNIENCCMAEALMIEETALDSNPYLVNFKNGVYNLETNDFYSTKENEKEIRAFLMTKRCEVDYIEGATCELWKKTLDEIFLHDKEYIDYVQRIFGYALLGKDNEHIVTIVQGDSRTGKSTVFDPIIKIMGDYYKAIPDDVFTGVGKDKALVLAESYGKRFAHIAETEKGAKLVLSLLKRISGGSPISGRLHHKGYFTYIATFNVFVETNDNPFIGDDPAMWERIHNIKFERYFEEEERDENLSKKLEKELSGILLWLLEGWKKYQQRRLTKPAKAVKDTQAHKDENDILKQFLDDCFNLTTDKNDYVTGQVLFQTYCIWADRNKLSPKERLNGIKFGQEMKKRKEIVYNSKIYYDEKGEKINRKVYMGMELKRG